MLKSLLVISILIVAFNTYAGDDTIHAKCLGMSEALNLPDEKVFKAFVATEGKHVQDKYGKNSDEHVALLIKNAVGVGYGKGFIEGFLYGQSRDTALKTVMQYCWNNNYAVREKILSKLNFLN